MAACARGDESHAAVAKRFGVTLSALKYHWYRRGKEPPSSTAIEMLPVRMVDGSETAEVRLRLRMAELTFPSGTSPEYVAALVRALESSC